MFWLWLINQKKKIEKCRRSGWSAQEGRKREVLFVAYFVLFYETVQNPLRGLYKKHKEDNK